MWLNWNARNTDISILDTIKQAHDGQLTQLLAQQIGVAEDTIEAALSPAVEDIARRIRDKAENDPQDYEDLAETIDEEKQAHYLTDPAWTFSQDALGDGRHILSHLYGSGDAAVAEISPAGLADDKAELFVSYVATFYVAALANRNQILSLSGQTGNDDDAGNGWLQILLAALLKGIMDALKPRRRRRRRRYTRRRSTSRRRSTRRRSRRRRRRKKTPSLNDLIGDLFRG